MKDRRTELSVLEIKINFKLDSGVKPRNDVFGGRVGINGGDQVAYKES